MVAQGKVDLPRVKVSSAWGCCMRLNREIEWDERGPCMRLNGEIEWFLHKSEWGACTRLNREIEQGERGPCTRLNGELGTVSAQV